VTPFRTILAGTVVAHLVTMNIGDIKQQNPHIPWRASVLALLVAAGSIAMVAGCTAQVETASPGVVDDEVEAPAAPARYETYPQTEYRGHVVYLVDGRWYYPRGRRWYYYRTEPAPLVRHRTYVQSAPPARPAYAPARPAYAHPAYAPAPGEATRVQ